MARRQIGQETLRFAAGSIGQRSSLDGLSGLSDWKPIDLQLSDMYCAAKGEPAWPPLALFKALLIAVWYDLSDVKLAETLDDRASFRRFCGFSGDEATPERTAFVRFRREFVARGLDTGLFNEITRRLTARAATVKTGTLVDATVIASTSHKDDEAAWAGHRRRRAVHGFKAHVGADADTALVEELIVTPANVHDGRVGSEVLPDYPGDVYADSGYRGSAFAAAVLARGGTPRVVQTSAWGRPGDNTLRKLKSWNHGIQRVRCRIEKIFGTWKRCYGLRRMRWWGLAKVAFQVRITAMAYNLKRTATILAPATSQRHPV
jgi:IS5 family transposase